jgi:hypothetical protein
VAPPPLDLAIFLPLALIGVQLALGNGALVAWVLARSVPRLKGRRR